MPRADANVQRTSRSASVWGGAKTEGDVRSSAFTGSKTGSMQFTVPRLIKDKHQHFSILFYAQGKRYRVSNGKKFGVDLHPNKEPFDRRLIVAQEHRAAGGSLIQALPHPGHLEFLCVWCEGDEGQDARQGREVQRLAPFHVLP